MPTKIEWADDVINPIIGCTPISEGCTHCYAQRMACRLANIPTTAERYRKVVNLCQTGRPSWNGKTAFVQSELDKPAHWKKPKRIFVGSMGDVFHESAKAEWIDKILQVAHQNLRHTFIILTKRPSRMATHIWPSKNVWVGVTAENQEQADKRIPLLLSIPAAVRFVSVEPMLGPVDLRKYLSCKEMDFDCRDCYGTYKGEGAKICNENGYAPTVNDRKLNWVICGGETGPGARPMRGEWARGLRDQCQAAKVPFFFKKFANGETELDGQEWREFPS